MDRHLCKEEKKLKSIFANLLILKLIAWKEEKDNFKSFVLSSTLLKLLASEKRNKQMCKLNFDLYKTIWIVFYLKKQNFILIFLGRSRSSLFHRKKEMYKCVKLLFTHLKQFDSCCI